MEIFKLNINKISTSSNILLRPGFGDKLSLRPFQDDKIFDCIATLYKIDCTEHNNVEECFKT